MEGITDKAKIQKETAGVQTYRCFAAPDADATDYSDNNLYAHWMSLVAPMVIRGSSYTNRLAKKIIFSLESN